LNIFINCRFWNSVPTNYGLVNVMALINCVYPFIIVFIIYNVEFDFFFFLGDGEFADPGDFAGVMAWT